MSLSAKTLRELRKGARATGHTLEIGDESPVIAGDSFSGEPWSFPVEEALGLFLLWMERQRNDHYRQHHRNRTELAARESGKLARRRIERNPRE